MMPITSDRLIRILLDNVNAVVIQLDVSLQIIDINGNVSLLFSGSEESLKGKSLHNLSPDVFDENFISKINEAIEQSSTITCTTTLQIKSQHRWLKWEITPLKTQDEAADALLIGRDITEEHQNEGRIKEQRNRLNAIFESAVDGIIAIDENGIIENINQAAIRIFDYEKSEVIGRNIAMLMPEPDHSSHQQYIENYKSTGQAKIIGIGREVEGRKKNGAIFPMHLSISEAVVGDQRIFTGIVRDISAYKRIQQDLEENKSRIDAIINTAVDGIITINPQGIIEMLNPAAAKMFEYHTEELIGHNISTLMPEPYHSQHDEYMDNYQRTGKRKIIGIGREVQGRTKSGEVFPLHLSVSEVKLKNRTIYTGIIRDITSEKEAKKKLQKLNTELEERVQSRTKELAELVNKLEGVNKTLQQEVQDRIIAETALRKSQQLYQAISINYPNGTINVLDRNLCYVFVQGKELYELGVRSDALIGTSILDRVPENIASTLKPTLLSVFKGESQTIEITHNNQTYELNAVPLIEKDGSTSQILVVENNITESKKAEDEIHKTLQKERQLNELKSRFVSMASHEFRTPLSTILSSTSLLDRYNQPEHEEKRQKHLERIKSNVRNLTQILNDFLSLDKLEEGHISAQYQVFDLKALCEEIIEEMEGHIGYNQDINFSYTGQTDVHLDKSLTQNILNNLLSNAIKYSEDTIGFNVECTDERININVSDKGIGIPEEDQENMFERFFRARNVTNIQGTGLGLNIVSKYVELLGGKIYFESKYGEGTTFFIELPLITHNNGT